MEYKPLNPFQAINLRFNAIETLLEHLNTNCESVVINSPPETDLLTVEEAAKYVKLSEQFIYKLCTTKKLPFIKKGKKLLFYKAELTNWMQCSSNDMYQ